MNNAVFSFPLPKNEPVLNYLSGSPERELLEKELARQASQAVEIPLIIGGREIFSEKTIAVKMPCNHSHILAHCHLAGKDEIKMAVAAAREAKKSWMEVSWIERASVMMRAAQLLSGPCRPLLNVSTMLGQGKNIYQAEIDAVCESIDFLRFNTHFASQIYSDQPLSETNQINRMEYRPLEGFISTISPFNFTSIALNLNIAVVIMGNTTVWKPASTSLLSNYYLMKVYEEAGIPPGVINFIPARGSEIAEVLLSHPDLNGIHFTGSTATFQAIWRDVSRNISHYKSYPRLVGETGGKDFVFAHTSADKQALAVALIRGAFEYQGQKCSAASRAYIPASIWPEVWRLMEAMLAEIKVGDVRDSSNFMNAVIDEAAFDKIMNYIYLAKASPAAKVLFGGKGDKTTGFFVEPTVILTTDPHFVTMEEEIFGPVLTIFVYKDDQFCETLSICDQTSPYALTGSVFARDKYAALKACEALRFSSGNFYLNDKPTGAMVGQQPFGGARLSGTNDKSGSYLNLTRWTSPRTIKETLVPATDYRYPYMT